MTPDDIRQRAEYPGLKAMLPSQERELLLALADVVETVQSATALEREGGHFTLVEIALARVDELKP